MVEVTTSGQATVTLPTDEEILITREFAAPKHLLYKAWTTPELVERWWSGPRGTMKTVEIDLRVGGKWRYVMATSHGYDIAFHGEYREIVPDERIVNTEVFEGMPGEEFTEPEPDEAALTIVTFTEVDGRTTLTLLTRAPNKEVRDAIINSGMEAGMQEQMDCLEQLAISLR